MTEQSPQSRSLISIEVGSINTRVKFFDSVEGRYRFLAAGEATSTYGAPRFDVNSGVSEAAEQLQEFTGRTLLADKRLLVSEEEDEVGANALSIVLSGGPPLKVVTVALLDEVSLNSVNRLVHSSYCQLVESFSLNDARGVEAIIDAICQNLPDLVVIAGGTNGGASRSVVRLANLLALAINLISVSQRPQVLYVGNEALQEEIDNLLGGATLLHHAANIRPQLDLEKLGPARKALNAIYYDIQSAKLNGLEELRRIAETNIIPASYALGRLVRFLSTVIDPPKGILGIDLGASNTTVASAFGGQLQLRVFPELGVGGSLPGMVAETQLEEIMRWLPYDLNEDVVLDYLYNKPLHPQSLPANPEELAIEQAIARQVMRLAVNKSLSLFPPEAIYPSPGMAPWFDRILATGSAVTRAPRLEQSLLMILDAVQPVGIATVILDQNNLVNTLGAAAEIDPLLAVHVLESNSFINLGTLISPVGNMRGNEEPLLRIQIVSDGERETAIEVRTGTISSIPLPMGKAADIYVQPLQRVNIGLGPGRGGWVRRVTGGVFGLVIDARGRPIQMPTKFERRKELLRTWQAALTRG